MHFPLVIAGKLSAEEEIMTVNATDRDLVVLRDTDQETIQEAVVAVEAVEVMLGAGKMVRMLCELPIVLAFFYI